MHATVTGSSIYESTYAPWRRLLLFLIQCIELPVVAIVAMLAIFTERLPQNYLGLALPLLLVPLLLRLLVAGRIVEATSIIWPLLSLVALCAVTVYVTPAWHYTWPELARLLAGVALCLATVNWLHPVGARYFAHVSRPACAPWRFQVGTLLFALIIVALTTVGLLALAPTNKYLPTSVVFDHTLVRRIATTGTFNPNRVAGVAVLAAPLFFALFMGTLGKGERSMLGSFHWAFVKIGSLGLFGYLSSALILTQSRGALLALGCALVTVLLLIGRRGIIVLSATCIIAVLVLSQLQAIDLTTLLVRDTDSAQHANVLLQDRNLQGRLILWQRALHGLADAPLTGMGLGAFEAISQEPYPPLPAFVPDPDMSHVHNIFLQVALDFGLPGLIAFVTLLTMVGTRLVQMMRRAAPQTELRTWAIGLIGTFIAYLVYNTFDALTLGARPSFAVWLLFGLWIGMSEWNQQRQVTAKQKNQRQPARDSFYARQPQMATAPSNPVTTAVKAQDFKDKSVFQKAIAPLSNAENDDNADIFTSNGEDNVDSANVDSANNEEETFSTLPADSWEARAWAITSGHQQ